MSTRASVPQICSPSAQANLPTTVVNQIYTIVNKINAMVMGKTDFSVVDTNGLVAVGGQLENMGKKDIWLNSLTRRIGLTFDTYRMYSGDFIDVYRNAVEWGAIVQKLYVDMPEAVEDLTYKVGEMDGQSVDQWIINNPQVEEDFFDKVTPYSFFITIQEYLLDEAFLSSSAMYSLINYIFGQVQNAINLTLENLGRYTLDNLGVNVAEPQTVHLLSLYNSQKGTSLNALQALNDPGFLGFMSMTIYKMSDMMKKISVLFNKTGRKRHTPKEKQRLYVLGDVDYAMGTVAKAYAFNKEYLDTPIKAKAVPYWNAPKDGDNIYDFGILSKMAGTNTAGAQVTKNNVVAVLCDYDAFGTFRNNQKVATTPMNARALYYNTFWHERQLWFNDLSENCLLFTLD